MRLIAATLGIAVVCVFAFAGCGGADTKPPTTIQPTHETTTDVCPGTKKPAGFDVDSLIGKSYGEAEAKALAKEYALRAVVKDGEPQATTMDYSPNRLNVAVEDGVVVKYCFAG